MQAKLTFAILFVAFSFGNFAKAAYVANCSFMNSWTYCLEGSYLPTTGQLQLTEFFVPVPTQASPYTLMRFDNNSPFVIGDDHKTISIKTADLQLLTIAVLDSPLDLSNAPYPNGAVPFAHAVNLLPEVSMTHVLQNAGAPVRSCSRNDMTGRKFVRTLQGRVLTVNFASAEGKAALQTNGGTILVEQHKKGLFESCP